MKSVRQSWNVLSWVKLLIQFTLAHLSCLSLSALTFPTALLNYILLLGPVKFFDIHFEFFLFSYFFVKLLLKMMRSDYVNAFARLVKGTPLATLNYTKHFFDNLHNLSLNRFIQPSVGCPLDVILEFMQKWHSDEAVRKLDRRNVDHMVEHGFWVQQWRSGNEVRLLDPHFPNNYHDNDRLVALAFEERAELDRQLNVRWIPVRHWNLKFEMRRRNVVRNTAIALLINHLPAVLTLLIMELANWMDIGAAAKIWWNDQSRKRPRGNYKLNIK